MATKKINRVSKIELIGAQVKPGPALASVGINMGEFTKQFNERTKDRQGDVIPTIITAYIDKSFKFELCTTPTTQLLKKAAGIEKGSANPPKVIVGSISLEEAKKIANYKLTDANAEEEKTMLSMVVGTALQMGIKVNDYNS